MPEINKVKIKNPITGSMDEYSIGGGASDMQGASAYQDGVHGLVPAPLRGDQDKFLKADGTWAEVAGGAGAVESVNGKTGEVVLTADDVEAVPSTSVGVPSGVAELDATGKLVSSQIPGTVGQVYEAATRSVFPATGEQNTMYIALDTNKVYRWGGSVYVEISEGVVIGTTSDSAARGDWGVTAYNHAHAKGAEFASGLYKITTNAEGHVTTATDVVKEDITDLGIQEQIQYATMPTASVTLAGKIVQYIGATDNNYINGYWYKCNLNEGTYSWDLVDSSLSLTAAEITALKNLLNN